MLNSYPVGAVLLSLDLAKSREFYADKLGLDVIEESEEAISYATCAVPARSDSTRQLSRSPSRGTPRSPGPYWDRSPRTFVDASGEVISGTADIAGILSALGILAKRRPILNRFTIECQSNDDSCRRCADRVIRS